MRRVDDIRAAIDEGEPADDYEMRRMVLRATSRVSEPAKAAEIHCRLTEAMTHLMVARKAVAEEFELRRDVEEVLDEIEAALIAEPDRQCYDRKARRK